MTDLTASKPMERSADETDVERKRTTDDERAIEDKAKATESELVLTLQRFLRDQGEAYSEAAIRDLPATQAARFHQQKW